MNLLLDRNAKILNRYPPGIHYVNETMKLVKDNMRIKKTMTTENNLLRDQLRMTSASKSQTGFNRSKGMSFVLI